jgi:hypothetical protein
MKMKMRHLMERAALVALMVYALGWALVRGRGWGLR